MLLFSEAVPLLSHSFLDASGPSLRADLLPPITYFPSVLIESVKDMIVVPYISRPMLGFSCLSKVGSPRVGEQTHMATVAAAFDPSAEEPLTVPWRGRSNNG